MKLWKNQSINLFHHQNTLESDGGGASFAVVGGLFMPGKPILCPACLEPSVIQLSVRNARNVHILRKCS